MLLTIDIGNTNVALGIFNGRDLEHQFRLSTDARRLSDEYGLSILGILAAKGLDTSYITDSCICSVVPQLTTTFEEMCKDYFNLTPLIVQEGTNTGVVVTSENPKEVGSDRIVNALAAFRLYGGPAIIVDFGTATVFDAISESGNYLGGAIVPGIEVSSEALHQATAQLRRVELIAPKSVIGRSTVDSLQSGLVLGYSSLVEGMVERFKGELGKKAVVIGTGGTSRLMMKETKVFDVDNPHLTLIGLSMIYEMNQQQAR